MKTRKATIYIASNKPFEEMTEERRAQVLSKVLDEVEDQGTWPALTRQEAQRMGLMRLPVTLTLTAEAGA